MNRKLKLILFGLLLVLMSPLLIQQIDAETEPPLPTQPNPPTYTKWNSHLL